MDTIKDLVKERFTLFNTTQIKIPNIKGWESISYDDSIGKHSYSSKNWGIRLGEHENGRFILSMDFDCCGDKDKETKERMGCEWTKNKLEEYISLKDKDDGMFNASTVGNANVLVDYTDAPKIREYAKKLGSKGKIYAFELFFGKSHQQVIPPSTTICKMNNKIVQARAWLNDEPFYILQEDSAIYPFVLGLFETINKKNNIKNVVVVDQEPSSITASFSPSESEEENEIVNEIVQDKYDDKHLELLFNVIRNERDKKGAKIIGFDYWFQIAGVLKYEKYDRKIFEKYSKLQSSDKSAKSGIKLWESIKNVKPMTKYVLQSIAKKINPLGYKNWILKTGDYIPLSVLERGENDISKYITTQIINELIFCNNTWFLHDKKTMLWRIVKNPSERIISHVQNKIDESREIFLHLKQKTEDKEEKIKYEQIDAQYLRYHQQVSKGSFCNQMIKVLESYLFVNKFNELLDTNPYEVAYEDGILDLKTGTFRKGLLSSDYLTKTIPYPYKKSTKTERDWVREQLKKICNYNEEHLEFYLSILGYSMTGDSTTHQKFWSLRGQKACNGKSIIFESLMKIIPNYINKMENNFFETTYGTRHKEIAGWRGFRIGWLNEMSSRKQDETVIKEMADGTGIKNKVMYGTTELVSITFKYFIISNNTLNINADGGIKRRLEILQLDSEFSETIEQDDFENKIFKQDNKFGEKLETTYKYALMDLIYEYSKKHFEDGDKIKPYPSDWKGETESVCADNNKFESFFHDNFEIDKEGIVLKVDMEDILTGFKDKKMEIKDLKDEFKRMKINAEYNGQLRKNGKRGGWTGIKVLVEPLPVPVPLVVVEV